MKNIKKIVVISVTTMALVVTSVIVKANPSTGFNIVNADELESIVSDERVQDFFNDQNQNTDKGYIMEDITPLSVRNASIKNNDYSLYYDIENTFTMYSFKYDLNDISSIYDNLSEKYQECTPVLSADAVVGLIFTNVGQPINKMREKIESAELSKEEKEHMLKIAEEREGKLYLSSMKKVTPNKPLSFLFSSDYLTELTYENGLTDEYEIKYVHLSYYNIYAALIKVSGNEYIVPVKATENYSFDDLKLYSLSEFSDILEVDVRSQ